MTRLSTQRIKNHIGVRSQQEAGRCRDRISVGSESFLAMEGRHLGVGATRRCALMLTYCAVWFFRAHCAVPR